MLRDVRQTPAYSDASPCRNRAKTLLTRREHTTRMRRRFMMGVAAAFSAAFGGHAAADSTASSFANATPDLARINVKLDRRSANLKLVQVVFRHGARTPLTDQTYLWEGQEWNCCGKAYEAVPLQLLDVNGGPATPNESDQKQVRNTSSQTAAYNQQFRFVGMNSAIRSNCNSNASPAAAATLAADLADGLRT
eukprot:GHUV01044474.1.p1 GENE.GHUV01044474.1~~GHUV01044474.1.p1  ORF type:complete len:193 (+),score=42.89 GHUV01044474.1:77-655(+)